MSQDPDRPAWMETCLGDAITRLKARIGEAGYAAVTESAQSADQWRPFQELLACSEFFGEQVARQHEWLCQALADGSLLENRDWGAEDWDRALADLLAPGASEQESLAALRTFRQREMLRILWRDHAQLGDVEDAFEALSHLADCCIRAAVDLSATALEEKYGTPTGTVFFLQSRR